jgi:sulfite exporter TauE/SafE
MELWTALILGLAGSLHCAGMCGPLALALRPTGNTTTGFVLGRLAYNLGRIITYVLLGAVFGLIGLTFALAGLQRWVSLAAGVVILATFLTSSRFAATTPLSRSIGWLKSQLAKVLQQRTLGSLLLLGLLNGALPCGLVYVACAGAVASGGFLSGVQYMLVFGLGTIPMMLSIGLAGKKLHLAIRLKFQKLIPFCRVALAMLLILRGLSLGIPYLSPDLSHAHNHGPCPACH